MTVKEQLVKILQKVGYDFITACESADETITEVKSKPDGIYKYYVDGENVTYTITIKKGIVERTK